MGSKQITINPGEMAGDGDLSLAFQGSDDYGGMTVTRVTAHADAVGTLNLVLQNYGSSGTVAGGTIAGMSDGTATVWAENTPQDLTLTAANVFVDAGEIVYLKKVESAAGNDLGVQSAVNIEYVDGPVTQG